MKRFATIALGLGLVVLSRGVANANDYRLVADPSGAPMCFTAEYHKAALSECASQIAENMSYRQATDPSGAPMCFSDDGNKAPLANCAKHNRKVRASAISRAREHIAQLANKL